MMLSGKEIQSHLNDGIFIEPFNPNQLNPNSYNLRLHNELLVYTSNVIDMKKDNPYQRIVIPEEGYILQPGVLYLGRTVEYTHTTHSKDGTYYTPCVDGRSSVGRLGINIHATAGFSCVQPVRIYPFVEIGQIYYFTIKGEVEPYHSKKYQNSKDVISSKMHEDFQK